MLRSLDGAKHRVWQPVYVMLGSVMAVLSHGVAYCYWVCWCVDSGHESVDNETCQVTFCVGLFL
jgi:hypothetical protein